MKRQVTLVYNIIYLDIYNEMDSIKYKKNDIVKKINFRKDINEEVKEKPQSFLGSKRALQNDIFEYTGIFLLNIVNIVRF